MTTISSPPSHSPASAAPPSPARRAASLSAVLRAMLFKESRELAPWTALLLLAFSAALAYVLNDNRAAENIGAYTRSTGVAYSALLGSSFTALLALVPPLAAALLGFLQFFQESRPDRFALLVHRPVARSTLFLAKLLTGVPLYLLSLGIPLFFGILWAANPRHVPLPFTWDMALPPYLDILMGIPYYFAGVLIARRTDARWFGSRLIPLVAPCIFSMLNFISIHAALSALLALFATLLFLEPARAAFVAAGETRPQSTASRFLTGTILAMAIVTCGSIVISIIGNFVERNDNFEYTYTYYELLTDGTPARIREQFHNSDAKIIDSQTLDGQPLKIQVDPTRESFILSSSLLTNAEDSDDLNNSMSRMTHEPAHYFPSMTTTADHSSWFRHRNGDYLVAYNLNNHALIGALGPDGFSPGTTTPPRRFDHPVIVSSIIEASPRDFDLLLASGDTVWRLTHDFKLQPFFTSPDHQPIIAIGQITATDKQTQGATDVNTYRFTGLATDKSFIILSGDGKQTISQVTFPDPQDPHFQISAAYLPAADQFILQYSVHPDYSNQPRNVLYINHGTIDHQVLLPPTDYDIGRSEGYFVEDLIPALCPPSLFALVVGVERVAAPQVLANNSAEIVGFIERSLILACCTAIAMFFLARRFQFSRGATIAWSIISIFLGPAAILTFLALRGRPRFIACPSCGTRTRVDAAACPHCHTSVPAPPSNGTEIFETPAM